MSTIDERVAALRERAQHKPQSWRFDDNGPEFVGYFQGWTSGQAEFNGQRSESAIAVFVDLDGHEWSVWCFHKVLAGQLVKADPQNGELVLISYLGKVEPDGGGLAYENYRVVVERANGSQAGLSVREAARLAGVEEEIARQPVAPPAAPSEAELSRLEHEHIMDAAAVGSFVDERPPLGDEDVPF